MERMRLHCVQCLSEVLANGRQAPTGDTLCGSCFTALWGPDATDELRLLVERHMGVPNGNGSVESSTSSGASRSRSSAAISG